jgi:GNAT superfamily N-acetyltransferase
MNDPAWPISLHDDELPRDAALAVDSGLGESNQAAAPQLADVRALAAFVRDAGGGVVGGAIGRTWGECCELQQLWVRPDLRGSGLGSALMRRFEAGAAARGCTTYYLETWSFQARPFYERFGYTVAHELGGFAPGMAKFLMVRRGAAPA